MKPKNTYVKLKNGMWGMKIYGEVLIGDSVTLVKRSGELKDETVGKIVWSGYGDTDDDKGLIVNLCMIGKKK